MTTDETLAALKARYGERWQLWYVPLALGGNTWCARRHGAPIGDVLNAHAAMELEEYITEAEEPT